MSWSTSSFEFKWALKLRTQADVSYKTAWTRQTNQNQPFLTNPGNLRWLPQSVWSLGWLLFLSIFIFIWLFFFLFVFLSIHQSVSQLTSWLPILGQSVLQSVGKSVCQSVCPVWYGPTERQMDRKILVQFNHIWSDPVSPSFCLSMSVYLNIFSFNCLSVSESFGQSVGKSIWQSFSQSVNLPKSQPFSKSNGQ